MGQNHSITQGVNPFRYLFTYITNSKPKDKIFLVFFRRRGLTWVPAPW